MDRLIFYALVICISRVILAIHDAEYSGMKISSFNSHILLIIDIH